MPWSRVVSRSRLVSLGLAALLLAIVVGTGSTRGGCTGSGGLVVGGVSSWGLHDSGLGNDARAHQLGDVGHGGLLLRGTVDLVGGNGSGQVLLVLLDLSLHLVQGGGGRDLGCHVCLDVGVDLLDSEAATCECRVSDQVWKRVKGSTGFLPKGPARALLRQRIVQMLPVEPEQ